MGTSGARSNNPLTSARCAGVMVPLFSLRSERNLGIGDIRDLYTLVDWARRQELSFIQLLPLSPLNPEAPYPYSAYSAFGLDPSMLALEDMPDIQESKPAQQILGELSASGVLDYLRGAARLDYARVDAIKRRVLWEGYRVFAETHGSRRAAFEAYREREYSWLSDFSLFSAFKERFGWARSWQTWPDSFRDHDRAALREFERENTSLVEFYAYTQWIVRGQWDALKTYARNVGVSLMGDLPIYVGGDSVDVWARRKLFDLEAQGGAPPDYFNWLGQNWSSPLFNWERMREEGYAWWIDRVRYHAQCFDALRFDHFRGISEYWRIPQRPSVLGEIERETGLPRVSTEYQKVCWFWPIKFKFQFRDRMSEEEWARVSEGQRLGVLQQIGAEWVKGPGEPLMQTLLDVSRGEYGTLWVVEDLGADMEDVYELRDRLNLAGMRVVQFFGYDDQGRANPHIDPAQYPVNSFAMSDTHDLPPLRAWVNSLSPERRKQIAGVYKMPCGTQDISPEDFERGVLDGLFASPANWVMVSLPTILGLGAGDRINAPGTVGPDNWTWRMPVPLEILSPELALKDLILKTGRSSTVNFPLNRG